VDRKSLGKLEKNQKGEIKMYGPNLVKMLNYTHKEEIRRKVEKNHLLKKYHFNGFGRKRCSLRERLSSLLSPIQQHFMHQAGGGEKPSPAV
jgi:hypothetical protein